MKGRHNEMPGQVKAESKEVFGSIITLPDNVDQINWLSAKLREYQERKMLASDVAPEFIRFKKNDYKINILEELLRSGKVEARKLSAILKEKEKDTFDAEKFESAFKIIAKHAALDNEHLYDGSSMVFAH